MTSNPTTPGPGPGPSPGPGPAPPPSVDLMAARTVLPAAPPRPPRPNLAEPLRRRNCNPKIMRRSQLPQSLDHIKRPTLARVSPTPLPVILNSLNLALTSNADACSTLNAVPETPALLAKCKLPFGLHIFPFGTEVPSKLVVLL